VAPSSSLELLPPLQRMRMAASTLSPANRLESRRYLPLCSALAVSTASTVCSAIHPCSGFPVQRSWGSAHPPGIPASRGPLRYRRDLPLLNLMTGSASAVASACAVPSVLQGFAPRVDRSRSHSVSLLQGLVSLLGFSLWDLAPSARLALRRGLDLTPPREQARRRFEPPPRW
jgi:hypothetical protein